MGPETGATNIVITTRLHKGHWWGKGEPIHVSTGDVQFRIGESPIHETYGGNFDLRPTNRFDTAVFKHDIPALFARHVKGLRIDRTRVEWRGALPAFFTHGLGAEDVEGLVVRDSELHGAPGQRDLALSRCPGAVVK